MSPYVAEVLRTWRASVRRPGFLIIATIVLALGVGASAAVFTLIDEVLLQPLPFASPARLVIVGPMEDGSARHATPEQYRNLDGVKALSSRGLALQLLTFSNVSGHGAPASVPALRVDRGLLPTLGVTPLLGRQFTPQEDTPDGPPAVILTYGFWQRRFAGKANAIGQNLVVEGTARTVVGVLPRSFNLAGQRADIILPLAVSPTTSDGSDYLIVGRLAPGATVDSAGAEVNGRLRQVFTARGDRFWSRWQYGATDLATWIHKDSKPVLSLFLASAGLLLLIALVNLTNLMFLRRLSRAHDMAVRGALGAPSFRIALPMLAEAMLVGVAGSVLGMAFATAGLIALQGLLPDEWVSAGRLGVGVHTWMLAVPVAVLLAVASAALGIRPGRGRVGTDALREGGRLGAGRESGRLGRILVVAQVAMATALLSTAGLFLHRLYDLGKVPLGFQSDGILTLAFSPVVAVYPDAAAMQALIDRMRERMARIPGVAAATMTTNLPAGEGVASQFNVSVSAPPNDDFGPQYHGIDARFLQAFHIPLLEGRNIADSDRRGGTAVALVSRTLARTHFGGEAIGKTLRMSGTGVTLQIVGVVGDTLQFGPADKPDDIVYVPMGQIPDPILTVFRGFEPLRMALDVRGDPDGYRESVRHAFAEAAPDQPIARMQSMRGVIGETTADLRSNLVIIGIFAGLALLLAAAGMYAVMAVSVAAREREFGVRLALGAPRQRLVGMVLRQGLQQVGLGLACGIALALACGGALRALLVELGTSEMDPVALAVVCLLLAISALLACLPSAWRASRTPPMRALRGE